MLIVCTTGLVFIKASAETNRVLSIAKDFNLNGVFIDQDEAIMLFGSHGIPMSKTPLAYEIEIDGKVKWMIHESDRVHSNSFKSIAAIGDNQYLALRTSDEYEWCTTAEIIQDGQVIRQFELEQKTYWPLLVVEDGFFVQCYSDFSSSSLVKWNTTGDIVWKTDFSEPIKIARLLRADNQYIAVGNTQSDKESENSGVMFGFDDQGKILWRYDSLEGEEFSDALINDQNQIIIIGRVQGSWNMGFITAFDNEQRIWKTFCEEGWMHAIVVTDDYYLVAAQKSRQFSSITLELYQNNGELLETWVEEIGDLYSPTSVFMFEMEDEVYVIANGYTKSVSLDEFITIIKTLSIGSLFAQQSSF